MLPGIDPDFAGLLGARGLLDPAALRHGDGCGPLAHRDDPACLGAKAMAGGLCPAVAAAIGRPLWRKPNADAALLPVPGDPEAVAARYPRALSGLAGGDRHRHFAARHPLRRGRLGEPDPYRLRPPLATLVRPL